MAPTYPRGRKLWFRLKGEDGEWKSRPTPYYVGDEDNAERYAVAAQRAVDQRRSGEAPAAPLTVRTYASQWIEERKRLEVGSALLEETRLAKHVFPHVGDLLLAELRPRHVRGLLRELRAAEDPLAPRSIRNVYGTLHTMLESAVVEEHLTANPAKVKRADLPQLRDKDPTWRAQAVYTIAEIERFISEDTLPAERRVMYALKAIGGLRHGEAAAERWRNYDAAREPLGQLLVAEAFDSRRGKVKGTKTEVPRRVPVHPALAKILAAWKLSHWERIYGRPPGPDDFIVPARTLAPLNVSKFARAMKADLAALGVRVEAGQFRARGGHDLRGWFITALQEAGAHRDLLRVITHTSTSDVMSGYTRASWPALCAEVLKLRISAEPRGQVLPLATALATSEKRARNRWGKSVRAEGLEGSKVATIVAESPTTGQKDAGADASDDASRTATVARLATAASEALAAGDVSRAQELLAELGAVRADVLALRGGGRR